MKKIICSIALLLSAWTYGQNVSMDKESIRKYLQQKNPTIYPKSNETRFKLKSTSETVLTRFEFLGFEDGSPYFNYSADIQYNEHGKVAKVSIKAFNYDELIDTFFVQTTFEYNLSDGVLQTEFTSWFSLQDTTREAFKISYEYDGQKKLVAAKKSEVTETGDFKAFRNLYHYSYQNNELTTVEQFVWYDNKFNLIEKKELKRDVEGKVIEQTEYEYFDETWNLYQTINYKYINGNISTITTVDNWEEIMKCFYNQDNILERISVYGDDDNNYTIYNAFFTIEALKVSENSYYFQSDFLLSEDNLFFLPINNYKVNEINFCEDSLTCMNGLNMKFYYNEIQPDGIEKTLAKSVFNIYPNPTHNLLNIELPKNQSNRDIQIEIFTVTGQSIFSKNISAVTLKTINLEHLTPGMYVVKINTENENFVKQIIKQ